MWILAIDTSHTKGSVSLANDGVLVETHTFGAASSHLLELGKAVARILSNAGASVNDIGRLALVSGPGSFTGLRIGMSYVKGLHASLGTDVVTMNGLELLASVAAKNNTRVCPMIDARKNEVYIAMYHATGASDDGHGDGLTALAAEMSPRAVRPEAYLSSIKVRPTIFIGSGAVSYGDVIKKTFGAEAVFVEDSMNLPSTALLCKIAECMDPMRSDEIVSLEPFYIRSSGARLQPLRKIRTDD